MAGLGSSTSTSDTSKHSSPIIGLSPSEIEFIAEAQPIRIIPNFSFNKMNLISGDVGPFVPGLPVTVPFWLAKHFFKRMKCRIMIPDWLDETLLDELKAKEIAEPGFAKMPSEHYMIISKTLFELCPGDIKNADEIKTTIKDIWDIRMSKLRTSVQTFLGGNQTIARVDNLTMLEIATIRPFFPHALEQIYRLEKGLSEAVAQAHNTQNDTHNNLSMSMSMNNDASSSSGPSQSQSEFDTQ